MHKVQVLILSDQAESAIIWAYGLCQRSIPARSTSIDVIDNSPSELATCNLALLDIDGHNDHAIELCRRARLLFEGPILLMTYQRDERFHIRLYETGVDECILKPIGMPLLIAKIVSWLRSRSTFSSAQDEYAISEFSYDGRRRLLTTPEGRTVRLSILEGRLVACFLDSSGQTLPPEIITAHVWANHNGSEEGALKNLVYRLRQKIEPRPSRPRYFRTVRGEGYCFSVSTRSSTNESGTLHRKKQHEPW